MQMRLTVLLFLNHQDKDVKEVPLENELYIQRNSGICEVLYLKIQSRLYCYRIRQP